MADKLPNEKKCTSCFKLYLMKLSRRIDREKESMGSYDIQISVSYMYINLNGKFEKSW